jgi:hypothetical protein
MPRCRFSLSALASIAHPVLKPGGQKPLGASKACPDGDIRFFLDVPPLQELPGQSQVLGPIQDLFPAESKVAHPLDHCLLVFKIPVDDLIVNG